MTTDHMTGAELQTLREACHLARDDLAALAGVQARTVKFWENGRSGVPADVVDLMRKIDAKISHAARQVLSRIATEAVKDGELVLTRYRCDADMQRYQPELCDLPVGAQAAIVARVRAGLVRQMVPYADGVEAMGLRVVWFEPEQFEAWRAVHKLANDEAARATWAAQALATQALPHRADQPPPRV